MAVLTFLTCRKTRDAALEFLKELRPNLGSTELWKLVRSLSALHREKSNCSRRLVLTHTQQHLSWI